MSKSQLSVDIDCIYVSFGIVVHAYHETKNAAPCLSEVVNLRMVMFLFTARLSFRRRSIWFKMPQAILVLPVVSGHGKIHRKKCCSEILLNAWGVVVDND